MRLRSLLFVPGDRPDRMAKALRSGADALILDLEDAVASSARPAAREAIATFLGRSDRSSVPLLFVRINALDTPDIDHDLAAIAAGRPDGVVFPKAEGGASIKALAARMQVAGVAAPLLPIASETPAAVFQLGSFSAVSSLLCGLTWGAEDLPAAVGAVTSREDDGRFTPPYELARSLTLFGAHAAGVPAIDTVYPAFRDREGLTRYAARAAGDGFTGMMAIHPDQIAPINAAFTPSPAAIAHARAVVAAFQAQPNSGALQLDGKMIDAPHLRQAEQILTLAQEI